MEKCGKISKIDVSLIKFKVASDLQKTWNYTHSDDEVISKFFPSCYYGSIVLYYKMSISRIPAL